MYEHYPHIGPVLPAMGYSAQQVTELEETIAATDCDTVIDATPATLARIIKLSKPVVRVDYELEERGPALIRALDRFAERHGSARDGLRSCWTSLFTISTPWPKPMASSWGATEKQRRQSRETAERLVRGGA